MNQEELQNKYTEAIVENLKNIALFKEFLYYDSLKEQNKKLQIENRKLRKEKEGKIKCSTKKKLKI